MALYQTWRGRVPSSPKLETSPQFLGNGGRLVNNTARVKRIKNLTTPWAEHIPKWTPREDIPDMLDRRQTISLRSHMAQPDCKGSTYVLEKHAVREIPKSNGHEV